MCSGHTFPGGTHITVTTQKALESPPSFWPSIRKCMYYYVCVYVQSVLWLRVPMDKWLGPLDSESDKPSSNPAQCSFFSFFFLLPHLTLAMYLLACTYICAAKLVTWGVGPDVYKL